MEIKNIKAGMVFENVDWDGPSTVVVLKVTREKILIARLNPEDSNDCITFLTNTTFGDERELLLEGKLISEVK